ncbi:MAG: phosphohistidine phosphatase SixA [Planctomycetes bacterium]|nr:phosphohistidine phosphatase SixA [Planctomycetota bacterium]
MKIYLVQHGNCVSKEVDVERPLSEQGKCDVERVAGFIQTLNISAKVWHSPKTRAMQTAEMLSAAMTVDGQVETVVGLNPNDDVADIKYRVASSDKDIMLVGHLPFMSKLASLLLTGDENKASVKFVQGGVLCLSDDDGWEVEWMVVPGIV